MQGAVNAEAHVDSVHDCDPLRVNMCANCAERGSVIEKAVGNGLKTKYYCTNCGSEKGTY